MRWVLMIIIGVVFFGSIFISKNNQEQRVKYRELRKEANIIQKEKEKLLFDKCNVFPEDGYLKTESGYYFDLFKFIRFIKNEQENFDKEVMVNPYKNLIKYFGFKLNDGGECVIFTFVKMLSWNENENAIINVKDIFEKDDFYNSMPLGTPHILLSTRKAILNNKNILVVNTLFDNRNVVAVGELTSYSDGWVRLFRGERTTGKYIILPLKNYPDIKVAFKDKDVNNGYIDTDVLQLDIPFVYDGYNNFGVDYSFQCDSLIRYNVKKSKNTSIQDVLNISIPNKEMRCGGLATKNYRLYREYGSIFPEYGTYIFRNTNFILKNTINFSDQFITKGKQR